MSGAEGFVYLVAGVLMMAGFLLVVSAPAILGGMIASRVEDEREAMLRQAELERKLAIADAAAAARGRGEAFVPPADYDR